MPPQRPSLTSLLSGPAHLSGVTALGQATPLSLSSWGEPSPSSRYLVRGLLGPGAALFVPCTLSHMHEVQESLMQPRPLAPLRTITQSNMDHRSRDNPPNFWSHALANLVQELQCLTEPVCRSFSVNLVSWIITCLCF